MNYRSDNSGNSRPTAGDCNSIEILLLIYIKKKLTTYLPTLKRKQIEKNRRQL